MALFHKFGHTGRLHSGEESMAETKEEERIDWCPGCFFILISSVAHHKVAHVGEENHGERRQKQDFEEALAKVARERA